MNLLPLEPAAVLNADEILTEAISLVPTLRERGEETERLRRLPDSTIHDAADAGIFSLLVPRQLGGAGAGLQEFVDLLRILARGDLSAAWTLGFLTSHNWMIARFPKNVQDEVFAEGPPSLMAMVAHPVGKAIPVADGFELTGHWRYCSGVMHADWVVVTALIEGDESGAVSMFLLPRSDVDVIDTWYMAGMQGSGSNDVKIDSQFVPAERSIPFDDLFGRKNPGAKLYSEPIYGYDARSVMTFLFPAMAIGAAEGLLEDYRRRLDKRFAAFSKTLAGDTVAAQMRYARATSALRLAQARLDHSVKITIDLNASAADDMSHELRALIKLDCLAVCRMAWESVQLVMGGSGSSVYRSSETTQRVVRDLQVLLSHMTIDEDRFLELSGEILLGRATSDDPTRDFV
ncbi:acyl-CoA dehydrogenase family protein [Subtercola sp. YIM 133946]|uniref:acyl-CoA dehydrogenase family protein n=1 Tax=Subtercola sp. YIM 133946 TaxID=3118909 RepID=UPI002F925780